MKKDIFKPELDVMEFDSEDVIIVSGVTVGPVDPGKTGGVDDSDGFDD